jgi:hypothetical protein
MLVDSDGNSLGVLCLEKEIGRYGRRVIAVAKRENCSARKDQHNNLARFPRPDLVKAAIDGRLPHGVGVARLSDLPAEWSKQHQMLGFPMQ